MQKPRQLLRGFAPPPPDPLFLFTVHNYYAQLRMTALARRTCMHRIQLKRLDALRILTGSTCNRSPFCEHQKAHQVRLATIYDDDVIKDSSLPRSNDIGFMYNIMAMGA